MKTALMAVRFLGVLGAAWVVWGLIVTSVFNAAGGAPITPAYLLGVTIPYALWAILLVLPYSKIRGGLWTAALAALCVSGAYVCLYMATHLGPEHWIMILPPLLLLLSQPAAIWLSRHKLPNQSLE